MKKKTIFILYILLNLVFIIKSEDLTINIKEKKTYIKNFDAIDKRDLQIEVIQDNKSGEEIEVINVESVLNLPFYKYEERVNIDVKYYLSPKKEIYHEKIILSLDKLIEFSRKNKLFLNYFYYYHIYKVKIKSEIVTIKTNRVKIYFNNDLINNFEIQTTKYFKFYIYKDFLKWKDDKILFEGYKKNADKCYEILVNIFSFNPPKGGGFIPVIILPDLISNYTSGANRSIYIKGTELSQLFFDKNIFGTIYVFSHELSHLFMYEFGTQPDWMAERIADFFCSKPLDVIFPEKFTNWDYNRNIAKYFDTNKRDFINEEINKMKDVDLLRTKHILMIFKDLEELCSEDIWAKTFKSMREDNYKFYKLIETTRDDYKKTQEFIEYIQKNTDKDIIGFFKEKGFKYKFKEKNK